MEMKDQLTRALAALQTLNGCKPPCDICEEVECDGGIEVAIAQLSAALAQLSHAATFEAWVARDGSKHKYLHYFCAKPVFEDNNEFYPNFEAQNGFNCGGLPDELLPKLAPGTCAPCTVVILKRGGGAENGQDSQDGQEG